MKTRSKLVYFPGCRFALKTLLPCHKLAVVAACLEEAGHTTEICDYGTPQTLDRLFPKGLHTKAQTIADWFLGNSAGGALTTLSALWQLRGVDGVLRAEQDALGAEIAQEIAADPGLDFVGFYVEHPEELRGTLEIAARLRTLVPSLRLAAVGPFIEQYGEPLAQMTEMFQGLFVGDPEWSLVRWAEHLDRPEKWGLLPNFLHRVHGRTRTTAECVGLDLDALPPPAYRSDIYPALAGHAKLKLFGVEASRGTGMHHAPRTRLPGTICAELAELISEHGVRAFALLGSEAPAAHVESVAYEILARGFAIWYSRSGAIHDAKAAGLSALKASGCCALAFSIPSGSQWLLDEYYRRDFGITEAEHVLRASKFHGLFTIPRFTYPCPADDYHTRAETLRLVERTQPHAVGIDLPHLKASALGVRGAQRCAFDIDLDRYVQFVASGRDRFSLPLLQRRADAYPKPPRTLAEVLSQRDVLLREMEGLGVCTTLSEQDALVARVSGYEGHEEDFSALMRQRLFTGDAGSVAATVERFNGRVALPTGVAAFRAFEPTLAAVGN